MRDIDKLTDNVIRGLNAHQMTCYGACDTCPYFGRNQCLANLLEDALKVINHWKGKYESTLLNTPPMILNVNQEPSIIKVESSDIKKTLKYSEALQKLADSGKQASEALNDVTKALKDFKEAFPDESPNISDIDFGKWDLVGGVFGECYTFRCTKCGTNVCIPASKIREVVLFDKCPNCKTWMRGGTKND